MYNVNIKPDFGWLIDINDYKIENSPFGKAEFFDRMMKQNRVNLASANTTSRVKISL